MIEEKLMPSYCTHEVRGEIKKIDDGETSKSEPEIKRYSIVMTTEKTFTSTNNSRGRQKYEGVIHGHAC